MDIVKTMDMAAELREELAKAIPTSTEEEKEAAVAFHETSIVDGTANGVLRTIINEAMPVYAKIRGLFEKSVNENRDVELIQLLAPSRSEMAGAKGRALVVAEAAAPNRIAGDSGVKLDFIPFVRRLSEVVGELGEGRAEYTLMMMETGRLIILKDLDEYSVIIESRKGPDEKLFLATVDHTITFLKDIIRLTRLQDR